jgi:glycosyltransferase involved in cell wall biosynthesis
MTNEVRSGAVSVVVCTWNNWPDVELTIESALNQSYRPLEVIVVDNSSSDPTPDRAPSIFGERIRYIRQPNIGDCGAYNAGFRISRGEFIQFVDGDDVLAPTKIEKQMEIFQNNPDLDIVYGDVRMFQTLPGPAVWQDVATGPEDDILKTFSAATRWTGIVALGMLFRRTAIEKVGPWDESLYVGDVDYWMRAAWQGCRFGHCAGGPMGFARRRPDQMSANLKALEDGKETLWEKTLGYVDREPYRSLISAKLAQMRFHRALLDRTSRMEALKKLALARRTNRQTVSILAFALAYAAIVLPFARTLVRSRSLQKVRRSLAVALRLASERNPHLANSRM